MEWFDKIKSGEKKIEYREYKPYWITRIKNYFEFNDMELEAMYKGGIIFYELIQPLVFRLGYSGESLKAVVKSISIINGASTDLAIDKPVFAIALELIKNKGE